jgi:ankyrin repeat protein
VGKQMVQWLIDQGIDVNAVNRQQKTAMFFAASQGPVETLRILIKHGARVTRLPDGRTPLLVAAYSGRDAVCEFLLANGLASLDEAGTHISQRAYTARRVTHAMLNRPVLLWVERADDQGNTALLRACLSGSLSCAQFLLARGASPHVSNSSGWTPLLAAGRSGQLPLIMFLLENDDGLSLLEQRDQKDRTVLLHACRKGDVECIEYLLSKGCSLDDSNQMVSLWRCVCSCARAYVFLTCSH